MFFRFPFHISLGLVSLCTCFFEGTFLLFQFDHGSLICTSYCVCGGSPSSFPCHGTPIVYLSFFSVPSLFLTASLVLTIDQFNWYRPFSIMENVRAGMIVAMCQSRMTITLQCVEYHILEMQFCCKKLSTRVHSRYELLIGAFDFKLQLLVAWRSSRSDSFGSGS